MSGVKKHNENMERYLSGEMSQPERYNFEKRMLEDPFLMDAVEGAEAIGLNQYRKDLDRLNEQVLQKHTKKFVFLKVAAIITLLVVGTYATWFINQDLQTDEISRNVDQERIATEDTTASPQEIVVPEEEVTPEEEVISGSLPQEEVLAVVEQMPTSEVLAEEVIAEEIEPIRESLVFEEVIEEDPTATRSDETEQESFDIEEGWASAESDQVASAPVRSRQVHRDQEATETQKMEIANARNLAGVITDDFGETLAGVVVESKYSDVISVSDASGQFVISEVVDSSVIVFNYSGMLAQEITVGGRDSLNVRMAEDLASMQEIMVSGYGAFDNETEGFSGAEPVIGYTAFKEYLEENLVYPVEARLNGIEGRVTLQLVVSPTGNLSEINVKRGLGYGCDEEAIRLIEEGPIWKPASRDGIDQETSLRVRVRFSLD